MAKNEAAGGMAENKAIWTAADFAAVYELELEIEHKRLNKTMRVVVRRGISPDSILALMPLSNPLLSEVAEESDKIARKKQTAAQAYDMLRGVAQEALIRPKYEEIEAYIKDDAEVLNAIMAASTGIDMMRGSIDGTTFQAGEPGTSKI